MTNTGESTGRDGAIDFALRAEHAKESAKEMGGHIYISHQHFARYTPTP
jgi:hypothetical protein